jgi:hypothetical protein
MKVLKQVTAKIVKSTEWPLNSTDSSPLDDGVKKHKTVRAHKAERTVLVFGLLNQNLTAIDRR